MGYARLEHFCYKADKDEITIHDLKLIKDSIQQLKSYILFMDDAGITPEAEQHLLVALGHLDIAASHVALANYRQMKGE